MITLEIPGGIMSTRQINQVSENQDGAAEAFDTAKYELELALADTMLDQVDSAQQRIREIQNDISLLETMENALGLISENMVRVRRLAQDPDSEDGAAVASEKIRNLMMVNVLVAEGTEFDGRLLFRDGTIRMKYSAEDELLLETARVPEIDGIEDGDFFTIRNSLDNAATTINCQYKRIGTMMRTLLEAYRQLRWEIDLLITARSRNQW